MGDVSKKKEDAKKEIRSLLLSAPVGLTLPELERDYCHFLGNKLPSAELGYASTEEFLRDIPDTVQMTYKCGTLVLTGVSDASTKHIQKLVSNQRLDSSKKWATLKIPMTSARSAEHNRFLNIKNNSAYSESLGGNNMTISPHQDWRHQATRDIRHVELQSNPHQRYVRAGASLLDSPSTGPSSYYHHGTLGTPPLLWNIQHIESTSNTYERHIRSPALLMNIQHVQPLSNSFQINTRPTPLIINGVYSGAHSQPLHKNARTIPLFIQNKIQTIVEIYSDGIPLTNFSNIFRKHFGFTIDFWRLGFSSLYEFLCSLDDIVVVNYFDVAWVMARNRVSGPPVYNGPVKYHRPIPEMTDTTCQAKLPEGRALQTEKSAQETSTVPCATSNTKAQSEKTSHIPTSDAEKTCHTPTSDVKKTGHTSTSNIEKTCHTPTSDVTKTSHTSTSNIEKTCHTPTSDVKKTNHTSTSKIEKTCHTPTSDVKKTNHTSTSKIEKTCHMPTSDVVKANGLATSESEISNSSASYLDAAHNSTISHLNWADSSSASYLDAAHNSTISHLNWADSSSASYLDAAHNSTISHLNWADSSSASYLDAAHNSTISHLNWADSSSASHLNKTPKSPMPHLDEVLDSQRPHLDESYSSANSHLVTSCNIPLLVQDNIRQIMTQRPKGLYASRLPFEYRNVFKEELPMKVLGYSSVVDFARQLPHIIKVERPHPQGDWHLMPACIQTSAEISHSTLKIRPDLKRMIPRAHVGDSTEAPADQFLAVQVDQLPADGFERESKMDEPHADVADPGSTISQQKLPEFGDGPKFIELYVSNIVSPEVFWFQLCGQDTTHALDDLMDELNNVYQCKHLSKAYHVTAKIAQQGLICAALYPEDGTWYRALISGVKESTVEVFYIDYGNAGPVSISDLRLLKTKFLKLPAQAIQAKLSNIRPADSVWKAGTEALFLDLTRDRLLCGSVTHTTDGVVSLCLTDTSQKKNVNINHVFVDKGYAVFAPDKEVEDVKNSKGLGPDVCGEGAKSVNHQDHVLPPSEYVVVCRRYVQQAQLADDKIVNLINFEGELHLLSSELSHLFFDEDIINSKLLKDKIEIAKKVVTRQKYGDLFEELIMYGAAYVTETTNVIILFHLTSLPRIARLYASREQAEELQETITEILEWFDPDDAYWKGEDDFSGSASADADACSSATDSSDVLSINVLEQALSTLEAKRNRLLKRIIMENDCSPQSVDELAAIEQDMTRVEEGITKLQNKPAPAIHPLPLASEFKEQPSQKDVTEPKCSQPSGQAKCTLKVAPMPRGSPSQQAAKITPVNMPVQTLPDMTSLLQEQILLNRMLMERLNLSQETVSSGSGNLQSLLQTSHQPPIANMALNLLNPLLPLTYKSNLLQPSLWQCQGSTLVPQYQGLEQLASLLQTNQLSTLPQPFNSDSQP
ncbi:hypothetical protein BsWGS_08620 [Bradybaena similaris]